MARKNTHRTNPLSNPEDRKNYMRRIAQEKIRIKMEKQRAEQVPDLVSDIPRVPLMPKRIAFQTADGAVRFGPLRSWMKQFAVWLCAHPKTPTVEQQTAQASLLSKRKINRTLLFTLRRRVDFIEYMDHLQADAAEQARAEYEALYPQMTELMRQTLDDALTKRDFRKAEKIVLQGVERFAPKKADPNEGPRTVHIHLNARQQKIMETVVEPMTDVEVLPQLPAPEKTE